MVGSLPRRVLLIDDNAEAAQMLSVLLGKIHGHDVKVAHDGESGLELASEFRPELIFIDVGLPRMDGYQVAHALRQEMGLRDARLVALTGFSGAEEEAKASTAGMDQFLVKPPDIKKIEEIINSLPTASNAATAASLVPSQGAKPSTPAEPSSHGERAQAVTKEPSKSQNTASDQVAKEAPKLPPNDDLHAGQEALSLRREREALGHVFQAIAHDLGNYLSTIQLLARRCDKEDALSAQEVKETLTPQTPQMEKWISHLRQFARLASGAQQPRMMEDSVTTLLAYAVAQCRQKYPNRTDDIHFDPPHNITVRCDPGMLQEAFVHLLANAVEHSSVSQAVSITADEVPGGVQIAFRDEGKGLEAQWHTSVFDLFVRAGERPDHRSGRFGVGLPHAKAAIEAHGGTITLTSEGQDKGCTVEIWLPH